jgi:hypothetical protein
LTGRAAFLYDPCVLRARVTTAASVIALCSIAVAACGEDNGFAGSIDLGSDIVPPEVVLDEEIFVCVIQPDVLSRHSCATGEGGENGSCHTSRSALRLIDAPEDPPCNGENQVIGSVPESYMRNFEAVRFAVQADPESSPLYLRPTGRAAHPRVIFGADDPAAELIASWIAQGTQ